MTGRIGKDNSFKDFGRTFRQATGSSNGKRGGGRTVASVDGNDGNSSAAGQPFDQDLIAVRRWNDGTLQGIHIPDKSNGAGCAGHIAFNISETYGCSPGDCR